MSSKWTQTTIGEITEPISKWNQVDGSDEFLYFDISSIDNNTNKVTTPKHIKKEKAPSRAKQIVKSGDVLFSTVRTYLKNIAIVPDDYQEGIASTGFSVLRGKPGINTKYLFYFTLSQGFLNRISKHQRGSSYPAVRDDDVRKEYISVPDEATQHEIVNKIEELFSVIDACDQTILDTENKLSTYEYSFLKKCIYGDYLAESSNMLGSNSNSLELRLLPKGWQWKKLPELGELARGKSKHRPRNDKSLFGGKYPFIQTGEVRNSYKYIKSFSTTYNEKGLGQSKLWEKGTLCITIAANIADTAILDFDACFPDSVVGFIADTSICEVEYIEFFIRTEKERLAAYAPATAQKNINLKTLSNLLVPLPPLEEQRKIVEMAEEHSSVAHKLKTDFSDILRTKNLLKQSILKQAFEGKLV